MNMPTLQVASGDRMPVVGLGLWKVETDQAPRVVEDAVEAGYRHFDCACDYANEAEVGIGIQNVLQAGNYRRDELWITSKLWNTYHEPEYVRPAVKRSLDDLRLDYLDLYLIHFPIALAYVPFETRYPPGWLFDPDAADPRMKLTSVPIHDTWRAMEELVDMGLVRNIGVCNFNVALLRDLLSYAKRQPAVVQVEAHPYLTQEKLIRFCGDAAIPVTAFSPLGALSYFSLGMAEEGESVLEQAAVREIADRHQKTPAQVVLRWGVQRGTAVIPKTSRRERLRENIDLFDFELTPDEMQAISALNCDRRFNDPGVFGEKAFNTFCPIYD